MDIADLGEFEDLPVLRIPVASLRAADSPRGSGESREHVRVLSESGNQMPPIVVHRPTMRVVDGMHRLRAAQLRGEEEIEARFFDGDADDAFVHAVRMNITHGLPLSLGDRKSAARRIIGMYPQWSDRRIASVAGLAPKTVATIRATVTEAGCPTGKDDHSDSRVGRDGRMRPADISERREIAREYMLANPGASLRIVAQKAGISHETARSVRAALERSAHSPAKEHSSAAGTGQDQASAALHALKADPAFRSSESSRLLLRMLVASKIINDKTESLIDRIPLHCLERVEVAARECSRAWLNFADQVAFRKQTM